MQVLMMRTDSDGTVTWKTYEDIDDEGDMLSFVQDIEAHSNTVGVLKLEIFFQ